MLLEILCYFDLTYYPFDTQICPIYLSSTSQSDIFQLLANVIKLSGLLRHHEYELKYFKNDTITCNKRNCLKIDLIFKNQFGYYISSAYIPSCLLLTISYITFYFTLDDFSNRITVSLTSLLVLSTFFSQVAAGLPKTSYMKLIDIWFMGSIVINFFIVTLLVLIEQFRIRNNDKMILKYHSLRILLILINKFSKVRNEKMTANVLNDFCNFVIIFIFVIFTIGYSIFVLIIS